MKTRGSVDRNDFCFVERAAPREPLKATGCRPVVAGGRVFPSMAAAARAYRLTCVGVRYRVENGVAGWRWAAPRAVVPLLVRAAGLAYRDGRLDEAVWLLEHARRAS